MAVSRAIGAPMFMVVAMIKVVRVWMIVMVAVSVIVIMPM
jgi:hypothetical protein